MTGCASIGRLSARWRSHVDAVPRLRGRLRRIAEQHLPSALEQELARAGLDGDRLHVVRQVVVPGVLSVAAEVSDRRIADRWARLLAQGIVDRIAHSAGREALVFEDHADHVAACALDLALGRARDRWWYGSFRSCWVGADDTTAMFRLLGGERSRLIAVLGRLQRRGGLKTVLEALPPESLRALLDVAYERPSSALQLDRLRPLLLLALSLANAAGLVSGPIAVPQLLAALRRSQQPIPDWGDPRDLARSVMRILDWLERRDLLASPAASGAFVRIEEALDHAQWVDRAWLQEALKPWLSSPRTAIVRSVESAYMIVLGLGLVIGSVPNSRDLMRIAAHCRPHVVSGLVPGAPTTRVASLDRILRWLLTRGLITRPTPGAVGDRRLQVALAALRPLLDGTEKLWLAERLRGQLLAEPEAPSRRQVARLRELVPIVTGWRTLPTRYRHDAAALAMLALGQFAEGDPTSPRDQGEADLVRALAALYVATKRCAPAAAHRLLLVLRADRVETGLRQFPLEGRRLLAPHLPALRRHGSEFAAILLKAESAALGGEAGIDSIAPKSSVAEHLDLTEASAPNHGAAIGAASPDWARARPGTVVRAQTSLGVESDCAGLAVVIRAIEDVGISRTLTSAHRMAPTLPSDLKLWVAALMLRWAGTKGSDSRDVLDPGLALLAGLPEGADLTTIRAAFDGVGQDELAVFEQALTASMAAQRRIPQHLLHVYRLTRSEREKASSQDAPHKLPLLLAELSLTRFRPFAQPYAGGPEESARRDAWAAAWETATGIRPRMVDGPSGRAERHTRDLEAVEAGALGIPAVDLSIAMVALNLLHHWARWLRGFDGSSTDYLLSNLVRRAGWVVCAEDRIQVVLRPMPLDLTLRMAGYTDPLERVSWLGGRRLEIRIETAG